MGCTGIVVTTTNSIGQTNSHSLHRSRWQTFIFQMS
jgi:hypothetical protein